MAPSQESQNRTESVSNGDPRGAPALLTVLGGSSSGRRSLVDPAEAAADRTARAEVFGLTDRGRVRKNNEDQFLVAELERSMLVQQSSFPAGDGTALTGNPQGRLMMVADGVGGRADGEVASAVAVDALAHYALAVMPWMLTAGGADEEQLRVGITRAMEASQQRMRRVAQRHGFDVKMSTTLTLAYAAWPHLYVAHAGDSRAYLFRHGRLARLTRDHTLAQQMIDAHALTESQAEHTPWRSVLTNAVGGSSERLVVEFHRLDLAAGDVVLLCSDGLNAHVDDGAIAQQLAIVRPGAVADTCRALVSAALGGGGTDNVTVVLGLF